MVALYARPRRLMVTLSERAGRRATGGVRTGCSWRRSVDAIESRCDAWLVSVSTAANKPSCACSTRDRSAALSSLGALPPSVSMSPD